MNANIEIKYEINGQEATALIKFVNDVREGMYTQEKPQLVPEQFRRVNIPEQDYRYLHEDCMDETVLLGITS